MTDLGLRLRHYRQRADMTLEDVGRLVGVSRQTICRWELGEIENVSLSRIETLARAFGCKPWDLCGWNPPEGSQSEEAKEVDRDADLRFIVRLLLDNPSLYQTVQGFVSASLRFAETESV